MSQNNPHFLRGIGKNLSGLGRLGDVTQNNITQNASLIETILNREEGKKAYKEGELLSFEEIDRLYNSGISDDEKRAWVWYKRSLGIAMEGRWSKYYLTPTTKNPSSFEVIVTTEDVVVKDNRWEDITTVKKGTILGKPTKYKQEYRGIVWWVFVAEDGAKRFVDEAKVKVVKGGNGVSQKEVNELVKKHCLFYMNGTLLPYPVYAYGNMYDRELALRQDEEYIKSEYGEAVLEVQKAIIQQSKPRFLSVQNVDAKERPRILAISDFARGRMKSDNFFITNLREESGINPQKDIKDGLNARKWKKSREAEAFKKFWNDRQSEDGYTLSLQMAFRLWIKTLDRDDISEVSADQIIYYYLDAGRYSEKLSEAEVDTLQKFTPLEGERLFTRFLHEALTYEDQQKLDFLWNRLYNAYSAIPYHKVPVGFSCSAYFKKSLLEITPAQREAIAFMEVAGSGVIAYDVGVGKTMSAIVTLANVLYSSKAKRTLVVVPNPTYNKWKREISGEKDPKTGVFTHGVLSHTKVSFYDWYNLGTSVVKNGQIMGHDPERSVKENSVTLITYEGLAKLGYSQKLMGKLFESLVDILEQTEDNKKSARDLEKRNQKYRAMLGASNKGAMFDIDALGFDYIIIDEAHNFKNVFDSVPADDDGNKRYKIESNTSERAIKAFFLCNYIQRTFGSNVCLLTATPFTNSPLEIFSMMSLVGYDSMKKMGIYNLQQFMQMFIQQSYEFVNSYDGTIKQAPVVKSFNNRLILQRLLYNHISYKTGEEVGVKRPIKINLPKVNEVKNEVVVRLPQKEQVLTYLRPTAVQQMWQKKIERMAQAGGRQALANIARALGLNLDNALSSYLVEKDLPTSATDFIDSSPKLSYVMECIASVKEWHEKRGEECSGQVIYMNRGKEFFPLVKTYLEEQVGFNRNIKYKGRTLDEVEIISSGISQERKELIKDAFLDNAVKVVIGTATIREGIDLQTHGTCLYLCTVDWNPTDIKQIEGRIWRQGNKYGYVRVVIPLVQDSMDVFVFQKLEEKTARVNDIWFRSDRGNVLDQESLDPEEIKFALFSDVNQLARIKFDSQMKELNRRADVLMTNIKVLSEFQTTLQYFKNSQQRTINEVIAKTKGIFDDFVARPTYYYNAYDLLRNMNSEKRATFSANVLAHLDAVNVMLQQTNYDDKEVIKRGDRALGLLSQISENLGSPAYWANILSGYRELYSKVKKTEKTLLNPKGFSINDNISVLYSSYLGELNTVKREIEYLDSSEGQDELLKEVELIKSKLAVTGRTPQERGQEFAKLNYLLAYKEGQNEGNYTPYRGNLLPPSERAKESQPVADKQRKIKILKLKAKALLLLKL